MLQPTSTLLEKFGGSPKLLGNVTNAFLTSWERDFDNFAASLTRGEADEAARAVHRLKGSLGYFADEEFFDQVVRLESIMKDGDLRTARQLRPQFETDLRKFVEELQTMKEGLT